MIPVHEEHAWIAVLDHAGQQQMATMRAAVEALEATKSRLMADLEQRQTALDAAGTRAAAQEETIAQQTADNKWLQVQCQFAVYQVCPAASLSISWGHGAACSCHGVIAGMQWVPKGKPLAVSPRCRSRCSIWVAWKANWQRNVSRPRPIRRSMARCRPS